MGFGGGGCGGDGGGKGGKGPPLQPGQGEVRFEDSSHAEQAIAQFNQTVFHGATITVQQHTSNNPRGTRLLVSGLPPGTSWRDLKDSFGYIGPIAFAATP